MAEDDWKKAFIASAARAQVAIYFMRCLQLAELNMLDDAEHYLSGGRWRASVDLTGVPPKVVDVTESLCARALGLIEYDDPRAVADAIVQILDLWQ